ncbi:MAG TPA: hypothetical protein VM779_12940 [Thermoanaerobaculia bacterium]|nr:hypothetical protein [Thermoanaerobaculia bacterium]
MMLAAGAEGRTLHWRALDGAWNGGERVFRLEPGQELQLLSISAVAAGTLDPLSRAGGSGGGW